MGKTNFLTQSFPIFSQRDDESFSSFKYESNLSYVSDPKGGFLSYLGNTVFTASVAFPASTARNQTWFQELHASPVPFCLHDINLAPEAAQLTINLAISISQLIFFFFKYDFQVLHLNLHSVWHSWIMQNKWIGPFSNVGVFLFKTGFKLNIRYSNLSFCFRACLLHVFRLSFTTRSRWTKKTSKVRSIVNCETEQFYTFYISGWLIWESD